MPKNRLLSTAAYTLLGTAGALTFFMPRSLTVPSISAASPPDQVRLTGVVRDFHGAHADFDVAPAAGFGHYAGTVQTALGSDGRPVLADGSPGSAWKDSDEDLMAYWKFDDGGGLTAADFVGANPGSLVDGPVWDAGPMAGALRFDGVDDHVTVPSSPEIQITGDVTFAGWFKLDEDFDASSPDTMVIMEKFLDTEHDFHIGLAGGDYNRPEVPKGSLVFKVENGPDSDHYRYKWTNRTSWTAGTWYHFAATLTSSDTAGNTLFIDGVDDTDSTDAGGVGFIDTDYDAPFRIGGKTIDYNGFATDIFFKGVIDDVKIFRRALVTEDFAPPTAGGFKVDAQWTDSLSRPIAPHLYNSGGASGPEISGISALDLVVIANSGRLDAAPGNSLVVSTNRIAANSVLLTASAVIDGDVYVGVGGDPATAINEAGTGGITGTKGTLTEPVTIPPVTVPDLGASIGHVNYSSDTALGTDLHVDSLTISNNAILTITAPVVIVCEEGFAITNGNSGIRIAPGGTLDLYVKGGASSVMDLTQGGNVNVAEADATLCTMYYLGTQDVDLDNGVQVYANVIAPSARLRVGNSVNVWGNAMVESLLVDNTGNFTVTAGGGPVVDACGNSITDNEGLAGAADTGGISSASTLDEWFHDIPGVNQSAAHALTLTRDGGGVYTYLDDAFYPLDGRLFGNEGDANNNYFTYHIRADFQYGQCLAQYLEFEGGDGVWVFIDGQLVLDLGGMGAVDGQIVDLDRLGLTDGETYQLDLFYAQRQVADSVFRLRTTIELSTAGRTPTVSAMFD